jgi:hypothetical protein
MPNTLPDNLSAPEIFLLTSAATLLGAVKWLEKHPPLPEKWEYLNCKVMDEIASANA